MRAYQIAYPYELSRRRIFICTFIRRYREIRKKNWKKFWQIKNIAFVFPGIIIAVTSETTVKI